MRTDCSPDSAIERVFIKRKGERIDRHTHMHCINEVYILIRTLGRIDFDEKKIYKFL
ncbi:MAG: hypothetical protein JETT_0554 [Candidatus Jettenia ecosi]|uniref:Uncharacterized protein n=1 Tax=Candidatus Jettenia ecosi TaxID=2494326 RepID=A0A533QEU2_9BACT|nr:MAG: hypothetical protein JETT_0554 [Candidatus Jettenia ecosi]